MRGVLSGMIMLAVLGGCAAHPVPAAASAAGGPGCSAPAVAPCEGCSVTCAAGQQVTCKPGTLTSGDNPACWDLAKCECH